MELEQVQREIAAGELEWIKAMKKEYDGLAQMGAIEEIDDANVWSGKNATVLPGKAVFAKKPDKYKARCVVCGNYEDKSNDVSTYAAGVDASALRIVLRLAMKYGWEIMTTDVTAAFLNASLSELPGQRGSDEIYMRPPRIFVSSGVAKAGKMWRLHRALYGLRDAPLAWVLHRDKHLRGIRVTADDATFCLRQCTTETSTWRVTALRDNDGYTKGCDGKTVAIGRLRRRLFDCRKEKCGSWYSDRHPGDLDDIGTGSRGDEE
jgi:hypothetical protein